MKRVLSLGVLVGFSSLSAVAAGPTVLSADFTGVEPPSGWTVADGAWRSPVYAGAVDHIELRYSGTAASASVQAFPEQGEGVDIATFTASTSGASFDFPETTAFRSFRIASANGLALLSFTAYVASDSLDVPLGVSISNNVTGTSFDAAWNAVEGATGYKVYVWTNAVVGASAGTEVWVDDFSNAAAGSTSAKAVGSGTFNASYSDTTSWECNEYVYPSTTNGAIRLGASDREKSGTLLSPHLPGGDYYLRMRAWRYSSDDGTDMPIMRNSGGTTSLVQVVTFTKEPGVPEDFMISLPTLTEGDHLMFCSFTNKKPRVILDRVSIVSGYSEGHSEPVYIVNGLDVGAATEYSFSGLPSVPVQFAVEAYGRRGVSSAKTDAVTVDLSNPDRVAVLNACPISSLANSANTYMQNFDLLAPLTSTSSGVEWLNGTTLRYWQAYCNGGSVGTLKWNQGAASIGGLYALATNQNFAVRALGARSTSDKEFTWGIAFTNDTARAVALSCVGYSAQQWGFGNKTSQTLSVSVQVAEGLDWISAYGDGWTTLHETVSVVYGENVPQEPPVSEDVSATPEQPITVLPGQVLMLKWTAEKKSGTPGMMGIDDVSVTFEGPRGMSIRIADRTRGW